MRTQLKIKPLMIEEDGFHLQVKIHINKKVAHVLIDTGASKSVFDRNRIERLAGKEKMELNDQFSTGLGTSSMESHSVNLRELKIGGLVLKNYRTILLDLSHVNRSYRMLGLKEIDGVIGSDLLMRFNAVIDFRNSVLKFSWNKRKLI